MTDLHEPVKCGTCTACCRASSGVVLQPTDVLSSYDYIMAPATAELGQAPANESISADASRRTGRSTCRLPAHLQAGGHPLCSCRTQPA
jgi:hypothetical protein